MEIWIKLNFFFSFCFIFRDETLGVLTYFANCLLLLFLYWVVGLAFAFFIQICLSFFDVGGTLININLISWTAEIWSKYAEFIYLPGAFNHFSSSTTHHSKHDWTKEATQISWHWNGLDQKSKFLFRFRHKLNLILITKNILKFQHSKSRSQNTFLILLQIYIFQKYINLSLHDKENLPYHIYV